MYLLAHAGITLGAAYALEKTANYRPGAERSGPAAQAASVAREPLFVDYRFILLGALLPDIIDKPLGLVLLPEALANGRTYLHTLIFLSVTLLAAFIIYQQKRKLWGVYLAFGVLMHFLMDAIWTDPITFYWPFLGAFQSYPGLSGWILQSWVRSLIEEARLYLPEIAGFFILLFFAVKAIVQVKVKDFFLRGRL